MAKSQVILCDCQRSKWTKSTGCWPKMGVKGGAASAISCEAAWSDSCENKKKGDKDEVE